MYIWIKIKQLGRQYNKWTDIIRLIREDLNKHRIYRHKQLKEKGAFDIDYKNIDYTNNRFEVGDVVHYVLDAPIDRKTGKKNFMENSE